MKRPIESSKAQLSRTTELEKLRRELLRRIVQNEAQRRTANKADRK